MNLHELQPAEGSRRRSRRVGRGHGSGRVKTAGKGTKGQNARSGGGVKPFFEGGQNPWTMRVPHKRGFSRGRFRIEVQEVKLGDLEQHFAAGDTVTLESLRERKLIDDASGRRPVKLLGNGELTKRLKVELHRASASAREAVERVGGTVNLLQQPAAAAEATEGVSETTVDGGQSEGTAEA